jgi:hypothetical protein
VNGYVLDDLALSAGLAGAGNEHHRREISRLLRDAIERGPSLDVPALCLAAAAALRPAVADHFADIIAGAPKDAINVSAFTRSSVLDALCCSTLQRGWPVIHAAVRALSNQQPILTLDSERYRGLAVDVMSL